MRTLLAMSFLLLLSWPHEGEAAPELPGVRHRVLSRGKGLALANARIEALKGKRACVVADIDNTWADVRGRTRALLVEFATRYKMPLPAKLPVQAMRYDGRRTALAMGWSTDAAEAFHRVWSDAFWWPKSFGHDVPVRPTIALLKRAARAGIEIFHSTGRDTRTQEATLAEAVRMGVPYPDAKHIFIKEPGVPTRPEKIARLEWLKRRGFEIAFTINDTFAEVAESGPNAIWQDFGVKGGPAATKDQLRKVSTMAIRP